MKGLLLALITAYIMPSYGVLKRYSNQRDELTVSSLKADGVAAVSPALARDVSSLLGVTWNSGELTLNASLAVRFPGRCRLELSSADSTKVLAASVSGGKARMEGGDLAALQVGLEQACAILAVKSGDEGATREGLLKHLQSLKVETKNVSLARFNNNVSYLIGGKAEGQSSFWVYKDKFLPSRLRFADASGAQWDVRLSDYTSQATGDVWPRVIEIFKGNEPQLRVMVLNANTKADLSNVKF
jgi:hypothetical protein